MVRWRGAPRRPWSPYDIIVLLSKRVRANRLLHPNGQGLACIWIKYRIDSTIDSCDIVREVQEALVRDSGDVRRLRAPFTIVYSASGDTHVTSRNAGFCVRTWNAPDSGSSFVRRPAVFYLQISFVSGRRRHWLTARKLLARYLNFNGWSRPIVGFIFTCHLHKWPYWN